MANEKFTQLPTVANAQLSDIIAAVQGGVSVQETLGQVAALMQANIVLHFAGDPNGNVAGVTYQLCWDTTGEVLYICTTSGNAATAVWELAGKVTFPISLADGGTGKSLTASAGGIVWSDADSMEILAGTSTANQILLSGNLATPAWSTATYPATSTINQLLYSSAANTITGLTTGNNGLLVTGNTGIPAILAGPGTTGQVLISNAAAAPSFSTSTFPTTAGAAGSIIISDGTNFIDSTSLWPNTVGTAGKILRSSGTANAYTTSTFADTYSVSTILYASGANTITGLATANSSSLVTSLTGVPTWLGPLTNGQVIIGSTGAIPVAATLTAGSGISIANAGGSITISGTGSGIGWNEVTGTTQAMVADTAYVANNAGVVTLTLPTTAAFGTAIVVLGKGAGGWSIAQNSGQNVEVGSSSTTIGVGGSISSTNRWDSITMICTTANTTWSMYGAPQGNLTVV